MNSPFSVKILGKDERIHPRLLYTRYFIQIIELRNKLKTFNLTLLAKNNEVATQVICENLTHLPKVCAVVEKKRTYHIELLLTPDSQSTPQRRVRHGIATCGNTMSLKVGHV